MKKHTPMSLRSLADQMVFVSAHPEHPELLKIIDERREELNAAHDQCKEITGLAWWEYKNERQDILMGVK